MKKNSEKDDLLFKLLEENLNALNKAREILQYSMKKCLPQVIKSANEVELESCEALTARFARAADILTQKVLKTIFLLLKENPLTFIDKCNTAEKFGIIRSADVLLSVRDLRNKIAHEYFLENITDLFNDVAKFSGILCEIIDDVNNYARTLLKKLG